MITLFNLCEYEYTLKWKKVYGFFPLPRIRAKYNKSAQEIYDFWWGAYEKSGDPDDIPF